MDDKLEAEFREPFAAWKATPGPESNRAMLKALHPTIEGAVRTHVGESNPILLSKARMMALQGLRSYDPSRGRLASHTYNQLQGLKRANRQQTQILRVPERLSLSRRHLDMADQELQATLGRNPTDEELSNHTGFSSKQLTRVRSAQSGLAEGYFEDGTGTPSAKTVAKPQPSKWHDIVYDELDPHHKLVMEHAFGRNGRKPLQNQEIARLMNRSPGAISQAKSRIQKMLDEEQDLSPFGG